ncbi:MAG: hypothetical protein LBG50_00400 [Clostridiales Family XIII bacterium]|nr:hypothetical protein [Clostridiales Family XIII bacterium]
MAFVSGCSSNAAKSSTDGQVAAKGAADDPTQPDQPGADRAKARIGSETVKSGLGVDLTGFDEVAAAEVAHRIFEDPAQYLGMALKVKGQYEVANNYNTDSYIHSVVVDNHAGCCQPVFEFIWNGEHSFPNDYPEKLTKIVVDGVMKCYVESGETYYYIAADEISAS